MPVKSERMLVLSNRPDQSYIQFKVLGALAAGTLIGLLVGLSCGREGSTPALCTVVQTLAAIGAPTSVLIGRLRWPVESCYPPNVPHMLGVQPAHV
jgi:hypothetical protein